MKVTYRAPSISELVHIYNQFQTGLGNLNLLMRTFELCRFDPRLGEILILFIKEDWFQWNPIDIAFHLKETQHPEVFGVLCSHVLLLLPRTNQRQFRLWQNCCFAEVLLKKEWSNFFIGISSFGGKIQRAEAFDSITLYSKWGFLAKEPLITIASQNYRDKPTRTLVSKDCRQLKLKALFQIKKRILTSDYIEFLEFKISKRTAELDLKAWAKKTGNTKDSSFTFKTPRRKRP